MGTAGYRFVPVHGEVVPPPIPFADLNLGIPNAGGSVSGSLDVTWTATTPVCVGEALGGQDNVITPIRIGGTYCLPGSSLRGMVRAVTEIATFSHLGRINALHHHGTRTYEYGEQPDRHQHRPQDLKAGWLTYNPATGAWTLTEAATDDNAPRGEGTGARRGRTLTEAAMDGNAPGGYRLLKIDHIVNRLPATRRPTVDEWRIMSLQEKMGRLGSAGMTGMQTLYDAGHHPDQYPYICKVKFDPDPAWTTATLKLTHSRKGFIVCSGEADRTATKRRETLFNAPAGARHTLPKPVVELFHILHSDPGRNKRKPRGNWRYWLARMDWLGAFGVERDNSIDPSVAGGAEIKRGIPVFFHGTPPQPAASKRPSEAGRQPFFFGLSRVMRTPWPYSVGEVAERLYRPEGADPVDYVVPKLREPNGWDFARALFGEVDEAMTDVRRQDRPERLAGESNRTDALRGRVAFAPAFAEGNPQPRAADRKQGVLGTPRESFWPFYLRRDPRTDGNSGGSYAHDTAIVAGRKRYVARGSAASLPQGNDNERPQSQIDFLPAGTRFKGRIRFHNLHPVELGALLWALTFGAPGGPYRHLCGRAKAHGHGALAVDVRFARGPIVRNTDLGGQPADDVATYLGLFEEHMTAALDRAAPYAEWREIDTLRRLADPAVGDAAARAGRLETGSLADYMAWKGAAPAKQDTWSYGLRDI